MINRSGQAAIVLIVLLSGTAYAVPTLTLIPPTGIVEGAPGQTVGWGFTFTNDTSYYLLVDNSYFCQPGQDPLFTTCTQNLGTYQDYIATNGTVVPPHSIVTQNFDAVAMQGVGAYMISTAAPIGGTDTGSIVATYQEFSGNPNSGGTQQSGDIEAAAAATVAVTAFVSPTEASQVSYAANLKGGDSVVNLTNSSSANLCVNVYTYDPFEEMLSCCSCLVTPNGLNTLSALTDLTRNSLTTYIPTSITIRLLASEPVGGNCDAGLPSINNLEPGLHAWGTTLHELSSGSGTYRVTENTFQVAPVTPAGLKNLTTSCAFIQILGSNYGICKSCHSGGL